MNLEQAIVHVLTSYTNGEAVDTEDILVRKVTEKLVRRGMLNKSVATGEISISDYGIKVLKKIEASEGDNI